MVIPAAAARRALGIVGVTDILLRVRGGALILVTRDQALRELKQRFADIPYSLADSLIEDRRAEVQREEDASPPLG